MSDRETERLERGPDKHGRTFFSLGPRPNQRRWKLISRCTGVRIHALGGMTCYQFWEVQAGLTR